MSREEAVDLYLQGRIDRRMFVRALVAAGVTVASAATYANVLAPERAGAAAAPRLLGPVLYPPDSLNFIKAWGSLGEGNKKFQGPQGIAVDPDSGSVYVTDNSHRVRKFDKNGRFRRIWGGRGAANGKFKFPAGIAVDPRNGDVLVADAENHRIQKFSRQGNFIRKWGTQGSGSGQFQQPRDVAVGSDGRVYVVDAGNIRVQIFKPNGEYLADWGGVTPAFNQPSGIAVTVGNAVLVADSGNNRIQRFNSNGGFEATTGFNTGAGPFNFPVGVAANTTTGEVYVTDSFNHRVKKLSSELQFIDRTDTSSVSMFQPQRIAVRGNRVYLCDFGNHRVLKLSA